MRHYKHRNRYCLNSKLSEPKFLALLKLFVLGRTAAWTADAVSRWARGREERSLSRVTTQNYFQAICERILADLVFAKYSPEQREGYERLVFSQILRLYWRFVHNTHDHAAERKFPFRKGTAETYMDQTPFALETLPILRERLRKMRGFQAKPETFRAHFAYATLLFFNRDGEEAHGELLPAYRMRKIQMRALESLVARFEKEPLVL